MDKAKLLASIETKHKQLLETLALVAEEQMLEPHFEGGWSVKDLLAHITFWEKNALGRVEAALSGESPTRLPGNTDEINVRAFEESRDRPLAEVRTDFDSIHRELLDRMAALAEDDLADRKRFAWTRGMSLRRLIMWDTDLHYVEHDRQIRAWLEGLTPS
ncbi:MAG TPA: ClbS/DfsB family four-helix bundle protein [Chloroflexia bacterium]|nr:ClbS/DfsB family four-helix bundle protein [Chloroflexia bacterium]